MSNYTCTVQHFFLIHSSNCHLPRACFTIYPIHYYIAALSLPLASVECRSAGHVKMQVTLAATCIVMRRPFSSIYVILKKGWRTWISSSKNLIISPDNMLISWSSSHDACPYQYAIIRLLRAYFVTSLAFCVLTEFSMKHLR